MKIFIFYIKKSISFISSRDSFNSKRLLLFFYCLISINLAFGQWSKVAAGRHFTIAVKTDGTLWAWGRNNFGQLGTGNSADSNFPVQIGNENVWEEIACGFEHAAAIKSDGTLWAWGRNNYGQLGNASSTGSSIPVEVVGDLIWSQISAKGYGTTGITNEGLLLEWGCYPTSGGGCPNAVNQPAYSGTLDSWQGFSSVSLGYEFGLALKLDGTLWGWGWNGSGQFGSGNYTGSNFPVQIGTQSDWSKIGAGDGFSIALKNNGTLWGWGENSYGQSGIGTNNDVTIPTQAGISNTWSDISVGYDHSFGLRNDNSLWAWGSNSGGLLGDGTFQNSNIPKLVGSQISDMAGGVYHSIIINQAHDFCGSGNNTFGALGNGSTSNMNVFDCTSLTSSEDVIQPANSLSVMAFPNPAVDFVNLIVNTVEKGIYQVDLYDAFGRKLKTQSTEFAAGDNVSRLNIGQLAAGLYVVVIKNEGNQGSAVVLKE
jgi:alpha-tubulin suppressor-like RCC1 family protein